MSSEKKEIKVETEIRLRQSINLTSAFTILVTNTGGQRIFIVSQVVLMYTGSPALMLLVTTATGFLSAGVALCFVEVALLFPKAGGPYVYLHKTFGPLAGFLLMWGFVILTIGPGWALGAYTTALYITGIIYHDCDGPELANKLIAAVIMVTLIFLNCLYMKVVTKFQSVLSSCKILAMLIIIAGGMYKLSDKRYRENLPLFWEGTSTDPGNIALGLVSGYFSYGGWQIITILMEEVKDPVRNVPRSLSLTFIVVIALYTLTNLSYCIVLSTDEVLSSNAVAVSFGYRLHPSISVIISVLVALCCVSVLNVIILGQPRMVFAAGRNGHMPALFGMISKKYFMPWPATFFLSIPALIMLFTGTVVSLIDTMSIYACIMVSSVLMVLIYLRWSKPDVKRPIKVPLILPISELILSLVLICLSVYKKPKELGLCLAIIAAGIPVYFIFVKWKSKPKAFLRFMDRWTLFMKTLLHVETPVH